jgi:CDP-4-dehydro-6-deoxyglucose reductase
VLRVMSSHVTVKPSGREFFVEGSETLLKASLRAGLSPNYGCGNGNCGLCKARVVDGEVRQIAHSDYSFSGPEKAQGYMLMCSCTAVSSDLVLEMLEAGAPDDIPEQQVMTKVRSVERLTDGVIKLHLQTPRTNRLRFLAGQRVTLGMAKGGDSHGEYPIASCPCDDRNLLFHIPADDCRPASADFTQRLFDGHLKAGDDVSVWGPWGEFVLAKDDDVVVRPLIFAAVDTGFAPINSLIEHALAVDTAESMTLIWASTSEEGLYLANQARAWVDALDGFSYQPVIGADLIAGLTAALQAQPNILGSDVYLAGPAELIEPVAATLQAAGLAADRLHTHQS